MKRLRGAAFAAAMAAVLAGAAGAPASVHVESDTILRAFSTDTDGSGEELSLPVYEYLSLSAEGSGGGVISFYGSGWGRLQAAGEAYEDDVDGELFRAFFQFADPRGAFTARAGRIPLSGPLTAEPVDGVALRWRPVEGLALSAYGGSPVGVSEEEGRSGDATAGGRVEHSYGYWYTVGLSYRYVADDSEETETSGAVDFTARPLAHLRLRGLSAYNFTADAWSEHDYAVRLHGSGYFVEPSYRRVAYEGFFESAKTTGTPFHGLADSGDHLTVVGATAGVEPAPGIEVGAAARGYAHDEDGDDATYGGLTARFGAAGPWRAGVEGGRMDGDAPENSYGLGRLWVEYAARAGSVSVEGMYVGYDEPVLGEDASLYAAASGALAFADLGLTLRLTGEYAQDPYVSDDVRGTLVLSYVFDGPTGAGEEKR